MIAIDPGHGESARRPGIYDPGAVHRRSDGVIVEEADIALDWSLALETILVERGQQVWLTRRSRTDPSPTLMRATRARQAGCTMLVSVHCNSWHTPDAHGTETLYGAPTHIAFARRVQAALVAALGTRDRGVVHRPNLAVLRFPGPAVLLELAFLSHPGDRAVLLDAARRDAAMTAAASELLR